MHLYERKIKLEHKDPSHLTLDDNRSWRYRIFKEAFAHHYKNCPMYTRYCKMHDVEPEDIKSYEDLVKIQPVPSDAFRDLEEPIISVPKEEIIFKSTTSSTTSKKPIWFHMDRVSLSRTNIANKKAFIDILGLKDGFVFFLTPQESETGLVRGMQAALKTLEFPESNVDYLVKEGGQLDSEIALGLISNCGMRPRHLYGPPFALMHVVEYIERNNEGIKLDKDSRVMTTGGWKGVKGEVPRENFNERVSRAFGISDGQVRDNLGLTDIFTMLPECECHNKHVMPWFHISVRDPKDTNEEVGEGEKGLLVYMSSLIQSYPAFCMTGDMGTVREVKCRCGRISQVVEHLGRAKGTGARGCAIRLEEFMEIITRR